MAEKDKKRLVLLDAHAILHRAYHALPEFSNSKGEPTGALYGLAAMLIKIIADLKPDYIAGCFDLPKPTHRHEVYKEYKAGRKKAEEDLVSQIIRSRAVFEAFSIPAYDKEGFEADDVLGTIVDKLKKQNGIDIVIASGDMDTLQLVDDKRVRVYTLKKGINDTTMYDEEAVVNRFGFVPNLMADYKGLRGDPSDNIIGVPGIGEKTATTLIQKFGSVEAIYKALKKDKEQFLKAGIKERIVNLLVEHEEEALFSKTLAQIRLDAPIDFSIPEKTWKETVEIEKINQLFADLEFRTLSARLRDFLGGGGAPAAGGGQLTLGGAALESAPPEELKETSIALWLINSSLTNPSLEDILHFAGVQNFAAAKKIVFTELKKRSLEKVYEEIEKPLIPVVAEMEKVGIKIDRAYLQELSKIYHRELKKLEGKIWELAGGEFNINSPKQLGEILFVKLGLKVKNQKKTGGGALSTRESELDKMKDLHPIVTLILEYRELAKLLSTYIDVIPALADKKDRLHASFLQAGTTTGRMSSNNPNLQNIPNKSELGRNIRKAFVAESGYKLVTFDYSQIELRIAAFLSGDKKLIEIFRSGADIHTAVAAQVFNVALEKVSKDMRRQAKVINFGIIYGMGVLALKQNLGTSREDAQKFYNEYFQKFDGLARYLDRIKAEASRNGFTETFFGRRRYFEGITSSIPYIRAAAERMAVNAPIQGTEADIIKLAMIEVHHYLKKEGFGSKARLLLQVHDELVYEIKEKDVKKIAPAIKKIMENVLPPEKTSGVVCVADISVGENWGETEPFGKN